MDRHEVIKATVLEIVNEVAGPCDRLDEDQLLVDQLGLSSLHLARIVAVLELELDLDPFAERESVTSVRTVGDLLRVYDAAQDGPGTEEERDGPREPDTPRRAVARGNRAARLGARTES
ncbi:acyl carrier protein [Streptomyces sp. NBC_00076]|uniref:acyl carrier protein n=1 Tax=Streptomyces sp. NBC_00076 TaxID=2975642 RepID=UPI003247334C